VLPLHRLYVHATTNAGDRAALVTFYIATNGDTWRSNSGWVNYAFGSDPCDNGWYEVWCYDAVGSSNNRVM
jgi:hypothetical protein